MSPVASSRIEKDLLGTLEVPADAYYGIQTLRAVNNFRLSGVPLSHYPKLVVALAMVKQAAADANRQLGHLPEDKHAAISEACARLIRGDFHEQFVVDMIQGGAGTSTNMNANEVIANIALEAMGHTKGEYKYLHPNNDVNMAQSTNDAYPTAIRLGLLLGHDTLLASLDSLIQAFAAKGVEFAGVLKMGRTQLQDAVPMTLGQEFHAFATTLGEDLDRLRRLAPELLTEVNLGGTAIGTGINADPGYQKLAVAHVLEGVAEVVDPALGEHHVVVEVLGQALPQLHRVFVEQRGLVPQVVGAHDGGVARGVAAAQPTFLDYRHVADAVFLGQVVGGGQAVPAATDDDHVVDRLRRGRAPHALPVLVMAQ